MTAALHLPLLTLAVGSRVELIVKKGCGPRGKVVDIFTPSRGSNRRAKCPIRERYRVAWRGGDDKHWFFRKQLRPL